MSRTQSSVLSSCRIAPLLSACILVVIGSGCGGSATLTSDQLSPGKVNKRPPTPSLSEADPLFNVDHVPTFSLTLPAESWANLQANATKEEYTEADLEYEGSVVGKVGLRFKGDWSSLFSCFDQTGTLICNKLSMKLKFDEYDDNLRFFGLKRLNFNAYRYDHSKVHEPLAYSLYREMGVVAPRAAWANILVNGQSYGLFGMVEQIDGRFTHSRWPGNGDGNLYKEAWPTSLDTDYYDDQLETNGEHADHRRILALAKDLNANRDAEPKQLATTVGQWMSLDYLRRFMAVDEAIMSTDGVTSMYTEPDGSWRRNHNFYFYQEQVRDQFWLVPWDADSTLWISNGKLHVPLWIEVPSDCSVVYPVFGTAYVIAPGCDPVFRAIAADLPAFARVAEELIEGPFAPERIASKLDAYEALLVDSIAADPTLNEAIKLDYFHSDIAGIKHAIPILTARLRAIAKGTKIRPMWLPTTGNADFEAAASADAMINVRTSYNAASTEQVSIASQTGTGQWLHLGFAMQDEPKPWSQYAVFEIPIEGAPADLNQRLGVRLRIRASRPGTARLELENELVWRLGLSELKGWGINLTTEWIEYEFLFADLTMPSWYKPNNAIPYPSMPEILSGVSFLRIQIDCVGRNSTGQLGTLVDGAPRVDQGYVEVDDVEFITP